MYTLIKFVLVSIAVAVYCGVMRVSATTRYEPRSLRGAGGGKEEGVCLTPEILARAQREVQEQIKVHERCQMTIDRLQEEISLLRAGSSIANPASSCLEIHRSQPNARSGFYWIQSPSDSQQSRPVQGFCDMQRRGCCGGGTSGGWLRVAYLDMTDTSHRCPSEWTEVTTIATTEPPMRACARNTPSSGCRSQTYDTKGVSYTQICGRVRGYQFCVSGAFAGFNINRSLTLDDAYVDGVSITRGMPRKHVWTLAIPETDFPGMSATISRCPCTTGQTEVPGIEIPPFVGADYFCESGSTGGVVQGCDLSLGRGVLAADPVWDGQDCRQQSMCCEFNSPPWFCKQLPDSTSDSIEVRLCADRGNMYKDVLVDQIEVYVR